MLFYLAIRFAVRFDIDLRFFDEIIKVFSRVFMKQVFVDVFVSEERLKDVLAVKSAEFTCVFHSQVPLIAKQISLIRLSFFFIVAQQKSGEDIFR